MKESEAIDLKFHKIMAQPFIKKANRIEKNLESLEKEQRTEKSLSDIRKIREIISQMHETFIPKITMATGHRFTFPNLFLFVFPYREIQFAFSDATTNPVKPGKPEFLTGLDLDEMLLVSEDRLTLAYIGDAALEIGVMPSIWPDNIDAIPKSRYLDEKSKAFVENIPLSKFWDSLFLNDPFADHPADNPKTKGSLIEAIFGIIYLEGGLDAVGSALANLKKPPQNNEISLSTSPSK